MRTFLPLVLAVCTSLLPLVAGAQDQPTVLPPALETFVPATLSGDDLAAAGTVDLLLSIDDSGRVTDAQIENGLSPSLDAAAREAAKKFVFKPATRDGKPFAARIRYRYLFEAPPPPAAPVLGELQGKLETSSHAPLVGADVTLAGADGEQSAVSGADGRFAFVDLPEGSYTVRVNALGLRPLVSSEQITAGARIEVSYALAPVAAEADYSATARVETEVHEIVRRTIPREDLIRTAGTRGDPLRIIELLPGVARPPAGEGMVLIRGSAPADSEVFLGGAPIYNLYHFGGLTSVANGFLLSGIDLYPGNFSSRYGRKIGGVVETSFRDPRSDRLHGILDVNMIDASLLVETPLGKKLSLALAARRSYLDAWYGKAAEGTGATVSTAPVYYDYQAILNWQASSKDKVRFIGYGSFDELALNLQAQDEHDPAVHGRFVNRTAYHRGTVEWHSVWSSKLSSDLLVGSGPIQFKGSLGSAFGYDIKGFDVIVRNDWHLQLMSRLKLNLGLDAQLAKTHTDYFGPRAQQAEGDPSAAGPLAGRDIRSISVDSVYARPAAYAELVAQVTKQLELTAGTRVDYFSDANKVTVDPRFNARLQLGTTQLRAGVGLFSQPPDYTQTLKGFGSDKLGPVRAVHYGAGVEQSFGRHGKLSLDGFYKTLSKLVVNGNSEPLVNRGVGRIYGLEAMGRLNPVGRLSGFFAYTLSRSERNDKDGTGYRLFDYDQTHILTASGNVRLGKGWTFGSTFRLGSGNPSTPVSSSLYQANLDVYLPSYGATNSDRDPLFHRLDLRIEKRWAIGRGALTWYLDVQNVYNHT
ncbi:MAG TPA: TonB family protein, partial [Polyangiales bacterium]|nr:TonB family protein [Polyangiales bacterium]